VILRLTMPEESTTPDLVVLARQTFDAIGRQDLDAVLGYCAPDAFWDMSDIGLGTFEGAAAIRRFLEDWAGSFDDYAITVQEILDLGNGVVLAAYNMSGRPAGSEALVQEGRCWAGVFVDGLISALTFYPHIDEARSAAERLAEERADG
jgi:ketosteroid isomerase-like protein